MPTSAKYLTCDCGHRQLLALLVDFLCQHKHIHILQPALCGGGGGGSGGCVYICVCVCACAFHILHYVPLTIKGIYVHSHLLQLD